MSNPIIFNRGVKYIKLAKFDTGSASENLTTQLGEVNTIRVNYSDKGIVEYPISSITEHETYYLYRVATTDATSSADNKLLDYNFTATKTFQGCTEGNNPITFYNSETDPLGYFTTSNGRYLYEDTPNRGNLILHYTGAIDGVGVSSDGDIQIIKRDTNGNFSTILSEQFQVLNDVDQLEGSISFQPIEGERYNAEVNISTGQDSVDLVNFKFSIRTGSAYTTSEGTQIPVILEPFFTEPFYNGDYDVLVNNTPNARRSNFFFDVDYSDNIIQAVNQQVLISSSQQGRLGAPYARIQDYNYNIDRSLLPRYKGSRITKDAVNSVFPAYSLSSYPYQLGQPGQNLGVDTSGQPIVESLNTAIYNAKFWRWYYSRNFRIRWFI